MARCDAMRCDALFCDVVRCASVWFRGVEVSQITNKQTNKGSMCRDGGGGWGVREQCVYRRIGRSPFFLFLWGALLLVRGMGDGRPNSSRKYLYLVKLVQDVFKLRKCDGCRCTAI